MFGWEERRVVASGASQSVSQPAVDRPATSVERRAIVFAQWLSMSWEHLST